MNGLSNFLVEGFLDNPKKTIALFGGGFKPPTKGHLEVVLQGLQQTPEVNHIKILVGRGVRDGVTQNEAVEVWKKYQKFIPIESEIIPVTSPLSFYKDYLREHPGDKVYIFIGARENDEDDLKDVDQRSEFIKRYSDNVIPTMVSTPAGVSGTLSRKYLNADPEMFKTTLPSQLSDDEKEEIYQILISPLNEVKIKDKLKNFISKLKEVTKREGKETGKLINLIYKILFKKYEPTPEDKKFMKGQSLDLGKIAILTTIQLLPFPGTSALTASLIKLGKKYNFEILPTDQTLNEEKIKNYIHVLNKIDEMFSDPFGLIHTINEIAGQTFDFTPHVDSLTKYMVDNGMNVEPLPKTTYVNDDDENANDLMGKTAFYDPNKQEIVLYTLNRHPKDVMRSFAHEMIHHIQNLEDRLGNITTTDTREDDHLTQIEKEAYTDGNLTFRKWTETITEGKQVGNLYHYTSADGLKGILGSNSIKSSKEYYLGNELYFVSFTRNKNFHKKGSTFDVKTDYRITIDGDKLSNKYKIKPFAYLPGWNYKDNWEYDWLEDEPESVVRDFFNQTGEYDEQEERISFKNENEGIDNIKDYIISVDKISNPLAETINEAVDYEDLLSQTEKEALDIVDKNWDNFDGEECNKGFCDIFAYKLQKLLPDSKLMHTEESNEGYGHVWVEYKGKHYDPETPKGVDDWKELPWMIKFNKTNNRYPSDIDVLPKSLNEMTTQEMRFWAFHSDIFSQLRKFGEEKYKEFIESAKGERKGAVNYFWNLLKKGELSERLASQESIHKFKCDCG